MTTLQYQTDHIRIDPARCEGCWKCVEDCPGNVLAMREQDGRLHAYTARPEQCKACKTCVAVCPTKAISSIAAK